MPQPIRKRFADPHFTVEIPRPSEYVALCRGQHVPRRFSIRPENDSRHVVWVDVEAEDGRLQCVGLRRSHESLRLRDGTELPTGPALNGTMLRNLALNRLMRDAVAAVAIETRTAPRAELDPMGGTLDQPAPDESWKEGPPRLGFGKPPRLPDPNDTDDIITAWVPTHGREGGADDARRAYDESRRRPRRGVRIPDVELRGVAETYRRALASGEPPTEAVRVAHGPMARSTAGRWVMEARRRGFLGPASPRKAGEVSVSQSA